MTWEELVAQNWDDFDIQSEEGCGLTFRGPIDKVAIEDGVFLVYTKWGAMSCMARPWEACIDAYSVGVNVKFYKPYMQGDVVSFTLPYIGTARFIKGHLDRADVNG